MNDPGTSETGTRPATNEEFAQLLAANQDVLLWFIKALLPGSPDVDDILQNTNLVLWRKQESFQMGTPFLKWARAVARWEVCALLSKTRRQSWLVVNDELAEAIADTIDRDQGEVQVRTETREEAGAKPFKIGNALHDRYSFRGELDEIYVIAGALEAEAVQALWKSNRLELAQARQEEARDDLPAKPEGGVNPGDGSED